MRIPDTDTFLTMDFPNLWRGASASKLIVVDLKGNILHDPAGPDSKSMQAGVHPAWGIHGAVHGHRPDANCVVHSHTADSIAFAGPEGTQAEL